MSDLTDMSWLYEGEEEEEEKVRLPEGAEFTNDTTGFWQCGIMWSIYTDAGIEMDDLEIPYDGRVKLPTDASFWYWTNNHEEHALEAKKAVGLEFNPNLVWHWRCDTSTIIGWGSTDQSPQDIFGDTIEWDAQATTLNSSKRRHQFHMITLPSMVQALALRQGALKKPVYDYMDFARVMATINDSNAPELLERFVRPHDYQESELWAARADIWSALGEKNPMTYATDPNSRFHVESDTLRAYLLPVYRPTSWWTTVTRTIDPGPGNKSLSSGNWRNCHIIKEVFRSKEEAMAAANQNGSGSVAEAMPEAWSNSSPNDLKEYIADWATGHGLFGSSWDAVKATAIREKFLDNALLKIEELEHWYNIVASEQEKA